MTLFFASCAIAPCNLVPGDVSYCKVLCVVVVHIIKVTHNTVHLSSTVLTRRNGGENYLAEPKLFILTNWRFVIGGSLRIFKFMAIYNWRK